PLPFKEPDRLVGLRETLPDEGSIPLSYRSFAEWRDRNKVFESIAAMNDVILNLESGEPLRVQCISVSESYFSTMGVPPVLGRGFAAEEMVPGAPRVVVLGNEIWQKQFGGDANAIGKVIKLNGVSYTVIGVMPSGLDLPEVGWASLWLPQVVDDQKARSNPGRFLRAIARLKPGVTLDQARRDVDGIMGSLRQEFPETHGKPYGVDIRLLQDFVVS